MPAQDPFIGQTIDDFRIDGVLGKGGMGAVYKAWDTHLQRQAAIKILAPGLIEDAEAVKRFEREARILAEINHPNICQVYRIGSAGQTPYYAMEHLDGRSLQDILREVPQMPVDRAARIVLQIAQGLKAAHEKGITHRDIKPANIMLLRGDKVKIVDFGIAKAFLDDTFKTATGALLGTPRYMSPEQGRGSNVDFRSDIYSLGCTFYHMLTGETPFNAPNPIQLIEMHLKAPVRSIQEKNPAVPDKVCNLIYGMLEKSPSDRVSDYSYIFLSLQNLTGENTLNQTYQIKAPPVGKPIPVEDKRKARVMVYVMVAAVAGAMVWGVWAKIQRDQRAAELAAQGASKTEIKYEENSRVGAIRDALKTLHEYKKSQGDQNPLNENPE